MHTVHIEIMEVPCVYNGKFGVFKFLYYYMYIRITVYIIKWQMILIITTILSTKQRYKKKYNLKVKCSKLNVCRSTPNRMRTLEYISINYQLKGKKI